jgi:subtilisin family serine protease
MALRFFSFIFFVFCISNYSYAQEQFVYRLLLSDKGISSYSIDRPEEFLSQKSIDRRNRQGFQVDETDLPVSPAYLEAIMATGASIIAASKWVKTVVVEFSESATLESLRSLQFVHDLYPVFKKDNAQTEETLYSRTVQDSNDNLDDYGQGALQISLNNGQWLHNWGFKGKNKTIAVLDGGFKNADKVNLFDWNKILEVKNFTHENEDPLRSSTDHGTKVLSCMLTYKQNDMIGTAPEAEYYLFKTEVNDSEFPVEEDYWITALEYADSLGVDIISSSLGYFVFNDPSMNHNDSQLDGRTAYISIAASMAALKGMIVCNSAGNEGSGFWRKIIFPSDAENVLCVGAVNQYSVRAPFSSIGYASDGRVKPDIMAMGENTKVANADGISSASGTSFSCPVISGLTASLWQALPQLNSLEIIDLIRKTADRYSDPNTEYGYGIANFLKAYSVGSGTALHTTDNDLTINTCNNRIYISGNVDMPNSRLCIYTGIGIKILETNVLSNEIDLNYLDNGVYIVNIKCNNKQFIRKFIKQQ